MKKLILAASFAAAVVAIIPASASALTGTCKIEGNAKFTPAPLPAVVPAPRKYEFTATNTAAGNKECTEAAGGGKKDLQEATVSGEGELSCLVANGLEVTGKAKGSGKIKVEGMVAADAFSFNFVAAAGNVFFAATGPKVTATGVANFVIPGGQAEKEKRLAECNAGLVTELPFVAVTAGSIE